MLRKNTIASESAIYYPASDGKPMGETPEHIQNLSYLVEQLQEWFRLQRRVFVAGNMFVYYEEGRPRRHISPDVFVVRGIPKQTDPPRRRYLLWDNKPIDLVIELTSASTAEEDTGQKLQLYRDVLGVKEYFLFDPLGEYLDSPLIGYRRSRDRFVPIREVEGRLPSKVLQLHLEAHRDLLRLYDSRTQAWLLTPPEEREARRREHEARLQEHEARLQEHEARLRAESERDQLMRENEALRRRLKERTEE